MGIAPARRFFVLQDEPFGHHATRFNPVDARLGDAPRCPRCGAGRGARTWLPPFHAELELHGKDWGDFATGPGGDLLVSERFVDGYRADGLVGLSLTRPLI
jgi:hypothetical protein